MENTVLDIAVISFPRTASRSLAKYYAECLGKQTAMGVLHKSQYLHGNEYNVRDVVFDKKHILHGHWHTLDLLDQDILDFIRSEYKIVSSYRQRYAVEMSIEKITGSKDMIPDMIEKTNKERSKWHIYQKHIVCGDRILTINDVPDKFL